MQEFPERQGGAGAWALQASAGLIVGLSAIIYAISYAALLVAGRPPAQLGPVIAMMLLTAAIGALVGALAGRDTQESGFIYGPDSNTISVAASMLAALAALPRLNGASVETVLAALCLATLFSALLFYLVVRLNLADLVRYIPFAVMAGFLASTGWLMANGALNIIAGTPLTPAGVQHFLDHPWRPELLLGLLVTAVLLRFAERKSALLIPAVMLVTTALVNAGIALGWCAAPHCARSDWLFAGLGGLGWPAPWNFAWSIDTLLALGELLPSMLVLGFVGVLTILLSVASLELSYGREFELNRVIRVHAIGAVLAGVGGGFAPVISIGRTLLNRRAGGARIAGLIAGLCCLAVLGGAGALVGYLPKAALGGLVLYLGVGMLKQWLWDQRRIVSRVEFAQILVIVVLVAKYGYLVGFFSGVLIACIVFVLTYSRLPLIARTSDLTAVSSAVIRPHHQAEILKQHGHRVRVLRLTGYIFFGSAAQIDVLFRGEVDLNETDCVVLDFSQVAGIDISAIGVFQRILRRSARLPVDFFIVDNAQTRTAAARIGAELQDAQASRRLHYFHTLDYALEVAEDRLIHALDGQPAADDCFDFLASRDERTLFRSFCRQLSVTQGEHLCREGEAAEQVFFIESGSFDIVRHTEEGSLRLAKLRHGAISGEINFYTHHPRSAEIVALGHGRVYVLEREALERMRSAYPALAMQFEQMVIRKLAGTLVRTNELAAALA